MTRKQNFKYDVSIILDGRLVEPRSIQRAKHQEEALHEYMARVATLSGLPFGGHIRVDLVAGQLKELNPCTLELETWNGDFWIYDRLGRLVVDA